MAGRKPKPERVRDEFILALYSAERLANEVMSLERSFNPAAQAGMHPKRVRTVIGLAFMSVVASWEDFVERTLVRYVCGAALKNGQGPVLRYGRANNITHAYRVVSGRPKFRAGTDFLKTSDPKWIADTADFFFSAHGYGDIRIHQALLQYATAIRNRVAHRSEKCKADFKSAAAALQTLGAAGLPPGYLPGTLLLSPPGPLFGATPLTTTFDAYIELYSRLARAIVP